MSDIADRAQARQEELITDALAAHNRRHALQHNDCYLPRVSNTQCAECDDAISEARQKAIVGCTLCTDCQAVAEDKQRLKRIRP